MKYFVIAILCLSAAYAQYHGSTGHASGDYSGHHRYGLSLASQGHSVVGAGHSSAGPANSASHSYSVSYGHSGHRMGRSVGVMPSMGHVAVAPVLVNAGHFGHGMGRSGFALPVVGHSGVGHMSGGYNQGGHYGGHRYVRSVIAVAPVVGHGSYSGHALATGHYGSVAGHGHRMVRSPVGYSRRSYGGYSNAGLQSSSMVSRWGDE